MLGVGQPEILSVPLAKKPFVGMANGFVFQAAFGLGDVPTTFSGCLSLRQHAFSGIHDGLRLRVNFNVDAVARLAAAK